MLLSLAPRGDAANLNAYLFGAITTTAHRRPGRLRRHRRRRPGRRRPARPRLFAVSNDEEYARAVGLPVLGLNVAPRGADRRDGRALHARRGPAAHQRADDRARRRSRSCWPAASAAARCYVACAIGAGGQRRGHGGVVLRGHAVRRHDRAARHRRCSWSPPPGAALRGRDRPAPAPPRGRSTPPTRTSTATAAGTAVPHGDHVDYVHDGHLHAPHEARVHYDEHVTRTAPGERTAVRMAARPAERTARPAASARRLARPGRARRLPSAPRTCTRSCASGRPGRAGDGLPRRCRPWSTTARSTSCAAPTARPSTGGAAAGTTTTWSAAPAAARSRWPTRRSSGGPRGSPRSTASPTSSTTVEVFGTCARLHRPALTLSGRAARRSALLRALAGEPVEEDLAVEVVDLVLQAAGHEPGALEPSGFPCTSNPSTTACIARTVGAQMPGTDRQPSSPSCDLLGQLDDHRVDHVPDDAVDVVGERPHADPDLRRGQPGSARVVDGLQQVAHQGGELAVEGRAPRRRACGAPGHRARGWGGSSRAAVSQPRFSA